MNYNAKCSICGKPYTKCNDCSNAAHKPWLSIVDNANHYKIFLILSDYTNKKINKEQAKALLNKCDISDYESFVPDIKNVIDDIIKTQKIKKKNVSKEKIDVIPDEGAADE